MNDKLYAFNADSPSPTPLWMRDFTSPPSITAVPATDIVASGKNIYGNVGIEGTPVIDRATNTLYLVARTKESGTSSSGCTPWTSRPGCRAPGVPSKSRRPSPGRRLTPTPGPSGPMISFDHETAPARPGLALSNGVVLVSWAAHEDKKPYHGWVMGFDSTTLAMVGALPSSPIRRRRDLARWACADHRREPECLLRHRQWRLERIHNFGDSRS